jgi:hypothetical protein
MELWATSPPSPRPSAGVYGANSTATQVGVGTGEHLLDTGLISLYELLGKLPDKPAQPERP